MFFFTGTHNDYHKPSDDEDKINYYGVKYNGLCIPLYAQKLKS